MTIDPCVNFGKVQASLGYDNTALSIVLKVADGLKLPNPSADGAFNLVWFNSTDYADPTDDPNREIVRVTAKSTDTLTITRAQEGTTASTKNINGKVYLLILAITAKMITDIKTSLSSEGWVHDYTPGEAVNGSNLVFTVPASSQVVVYADGARVKGLGVDYTFSSTTTITFGVGKQPYSTICIDYLPL